MRWIVVLLLLITVCSCNKHDKITKVDYHFIPFSFGKIYLEKLPVNDEPFLVVDSAEITLQTDHLSFTIPSQEESVFQLRMNGKPFRVYFINDVDHVIIQGSPLGQHEYSFRNEGINLHLKTYIDKQNRIIKEITSLLEKSRKSSSTGEQEKMMLRVDSLKAFYQHNAITFADTTKSAGAFLFAYNAIDFEDDKKVLKEFVAKAGNRFPKHNGIQTIKKEVLDYLSIYEEELNTGDELPALYLPDTNGLPSPVLLLNGKYAFVDLWSTWCGPCLSYIPVKKEMYNRFSGRLSMINIAVDAEKENWKAIIRQQQLPGTHFIDEIMWRGKAAKTWKFDSIPFNYLVSPEGKILAKAIKADSLLQVLNKFVK